MDLKQVVLCTDSWCLLSYSPSFYLLEDFKEIPTILNSILALVLLQLEQIIIVHKGSEFWVLVFMHFLVEGLYCSNFSNCNLIAGLSEYEKNIYPFKCWQEFLTDDIFIIGCGVLLYISWFEQFKIVKV